MADEAKEVFPYRSYDSAQDKHKLDFRIQMGSEPEESEPEEEEPVPDPKDSSVPEPVTSSGTQLTIEEVPVRIASAVKDTGKGRENGTGKQTSSVVN